MNRRDLLSGVFAGAFALALGGLAPVPAAAQSPTIKVYKDPNCGCCGAWVDHMRDAGYTVESYDIDNLAQVKKMFGVPGSLHSCHTATVDGYVIEGHVPAADVTRFLTERPDAKGLAVPGMPIGSPGMEQGDYREAYEVLAFRPDGRTAVFARH